VKQAAVSDIQRTVHLARRQVRHPRRRTAFLEDERHPQRQRLQSVRLRNQYGFMLVSAAKHLQVKTAEGQKFVDWVTGSAGQAVITGYKIGGEQLFFPNVGK